MKTRTLPRFDTDALLALAGAKVFARGEAYFRAGQVRILAVEKRRVLASVAGTEEYRTELTGQGKKIGGECSCPAFNDWGFCKHMVATALAANAAGSDPEAGGVLTRIRGHLKGLGIDALVAMIVELAERDTVLFGKLDLASAVARSDDKTIEARLRAAIDAATRMNGFVEYHLATDWAEKMETVLGAVAALVPDGRAAMALRLAERAIDRIGQKVEEIDDSDGHCSRLLNRSGEIHLEAAGAVRPEPVAFARQLYAREMADGFGTFHGAVAIYAEILGADGLAEYRRLAAEAWGKLPPRNAGRERREHSGDRYRLTGILDFFAERDGDVEARIALRAADLSSQFNYLQLAEFCCTQGREDEALRWAREGLWTFEDDRPDERLVFFAADLLAQAGRTSDAEVELWRAFEKAPSFELYARVRKLVGKAACQRAVTRLEAHKRPGWPHPMNLIVRILVQEKIFDAAWAVVHSQTVSAEMSLALARASEATHPREAAKVYAETVERLASSGYGAAYEQAAALVARMAPLQLASEWAAFVAELKLRHKRKRNFMKLLA